MKRILGLSYAYHDSAAALIVDGEIIASAQEERFNRIKNYADFPIHAINYCLQAGGITSQDLDGIVFYEKPFLKFLRSLHGHIDGFPKTFNHFRRNIPIWVDKRLSIDFEIQEQLSYDKEIYFVPHHLAHAASAFYPSPFEESAILISDGVGEWASISYGVGNGSKITMNKEMRYPNSVGLMYSAITSYLGFQANSGEGKTMGLADYGNPEYFEDLKQSLHLYDDGSFSLKKYWNFFGTKNTLQKNFEKRYGKRRMPGEELLQHHKDMAASIQKLNEHLLINVANKVYEEVGSKNVCFAGGSFLNIPTNTKVLEETPFKNLYVQPAASDAGGALGAALWGWATSNPGKPSPVMHRADFGPSFEDGRIERSLRQAGVSYKKCSEAELLDQTAQHIMNDKVVGWFQGRMELGPRALGRRSILANPKCRHMKDKLNQKVKHRESFRPYGVSVLKSRMYDFFEKSTTNDYDHVSPFMLMVAQVKEEAKEIIPAVVHINGSSRVQTVEERDGLYYSLLKLLDEKFQLPMVVNTSFNDNEEPIVCNPTDAIKTFLRTEIDILVIGNFICEKA